MQHTSVWLCKIAFPLGFSERREFSHSTYFYNPILLVSFMIRNSLFNNSLMLFSVSCFPIFLANAVNQKKRHKKYGQ